MYGDPLSASIEFNQKRLRYWKKRKGKYAQKMVAHHQRVLKRLRRAQKLKKDVTSSFVPSGIRKGVGTSSRKPGVKVTVGTSVRKGFQPSAASDSAPAAAAYESGAFSTYMTAAQQQEDMVPMDAEAVATVEAASNRGVYIAAGLGLLALGGAVAWKKYGKKKTRKNPRNRRRNRRNRR